jgi:bis(5'-nucleosyl)-tetraphosphatase (symmetrical)
MAVYAIGDIHGCYDPLRRLLDILEFDPPHDTIWLVGDLVNRGPKSLKTLRYIKELGKSAITVLGNHDLYLLALRASAPEAEKRSGSLQNLLDAPDADELCEWLRHRKLAHYDRELNTMMVHAGTHPMWSVKKTMACAAEVEDELQNGDFPKLLEKMYGNTPTSWSEKSHGYERLRFIINCLTRMRMITTNNRLNFTYNGPAQHARKNLLPWYIAKDRATAEARIVFGHWSQLGLIVTPNLISVDTGCVWGQQLTAVKLDGHIPQVTQVNGQSTRS